MKVHKFLHTIKRSIKHHNKPIIKHMNMHRYRHYINFIVSSGNVQFDNQFTHLRISSNFSALVIYMETLNEKKENG